MKRSRPNVADAVESFVLSIRKNARWQYRDLLQEGQEDLDAYFSAHENTYDEYVDKGYDPEWVGLALREYKSKEADDSVVKSVYEQTKRLKRSKTKRSR